MSKLDVQIRWLIRRDMPAVLEIERDVFEFPWTDEDFVKTLQQRSCIGMVAEHDNEIAGYTVYELDKSRLHVLNMAVKASYQGRGVGLQMVERLTDKLSQQRRTDIIAEVRERNIDAQLFFRAVGFDCTGVLRQHYDDTDEDGYLFLYRLPQEKAVRKWANSK